MVGSYLTRLPGRAKFEDNQELFLQVTLSTLSVVPKRDE